MPLFAGAAREIITPEVGTLLAGYHDSNKSTSVHDDLTVTALALKSGDVTALLISATVCLINDGLADEIRQKAGEIAGVPSDNVILAATHTHSGPFTTGFGKDKRNMNHEYCEKIFVPKCLEATKAAYAALAPAKVGVGTTESKVGINRRQLLRDGSVILGQNPWDSYDSTMTVISFRGADGKPIANVVHVGAHPTAAGICPEISRDWTGVLMDRLDEESKALTLFVNGTLGDVAPRMANGGSTGDMKHMLEVGGVAAIDAVRAYKSIKRFYDEPLEVVSGELKLPFKEPFPESEIAAQLEGLDVQWSANKSKRDMLETLAEMHKSGDMGPDEWSYRQSIIRIGSVVFVPFPFETVTEVGMRLRTYSPFEHSLLLSCTNGSNSYLVAESQLCRGGYEVERFLWARPRQFTDDADRMMIEQNLALIEKLNT